MNKNFKFNQKTMLVVALLALVVFYMWSRSISSYAEIGSSSDGSSSSSYDYSPSGIPSSYDYSSESRNTSSMPVQDNIPSYENGLLAMRPDDEDAGYATLDDSFGVSSLGQEPNCALGSGIGLASSLLPREVAKTENFGDFAPDDILRGQNFLDTRNQIGFPETLGGNIRNGNQQIRADPPNPKQPYTWNNSTIVPDLMQRDLCT